MPLRRTLLTAALAAAVFSTPLRAQEPADWVDPFIGTTNFGTTNPGAVCPNGMMSVVPFNVMGSDENLYDKDARWWSAPYEYRNKFFTGFAHVTLSGVGCPELGSLLVMPTAGALDVDYRNYGSAYTSQTALPGYYSNLLTKYGIRTEVTATPRTSAERYTFPEGTGHILLNLGEGLTNESGAWVRRVSDTEVEGMKLLGTFCYNPQAVFPVYFVMRVSNAPRPPGSGRNNPRNRASKPNGTRMPATTSSIRNTVRTLPATTSACGSPTTCSRASRSRCAWAFRSCRPRTPA